MILSKKLFKLINLYFSFQNFPRVIQWYNSIIAQLYPFIAQEHFLNEGHNYVNLN
jgi:hypothetical protein